MRVRGSVGGIDQPFCLPPGHGTGERVAGRRDRWHSWRTRRGGGLAGEERGPASTNGIWAGVVHHLALRATGREALLCQLPNASGRSRMAGLD